MSEQVEECNQCGETVKYEKSRFCDSCGAEIRPLEVVFTPSLDENASGFNLFLENFKISYYERIYDFNFWLAKKSENLFNTRLYLLKNLSILQNVAIPERTEKLEETALETKAISNKIRTESDLIHTSYLAAKKEFDQGEIVEAKIKLEPIHRTSKKFGFYQWVSDIVQLEKQITDNLSCLHRLQKTFLPEDLPSEKVEASLLFSYYKLLQLENFVNGRNNNPKTALKILPQIIAQIDGQKSIFVGKFKDLNKEIPDFGFGDKFKFFFKSTIQDFSFFISHFKFNMLLNQGVDYSNLPKAWEGLQIAQKIVDDKSNQIYIDKNAKFKLILEQTRNLISQLTEDTENTVTKTLEFSEKFQFEEAFKVIAATIEDLTKYSMNVLIGQLEEQKSFVRYNQEIDMELDTINEIFDSGDYLESQIQIDKLQKHVSSSDAKFEVVENLSSKITEFQEKITLNRTKGESLLGEELDKIWLGLMENLTFADGARTLIEKKDLAHRQDYKATVNKIESMLKNLEFNQQSYLLLQNLENLNNSGEFSQANTFLAELDKRIKKAKKDHFPLLIQKVEDFKNALSKSLEGVENTIGLEISKAQKLVAENLDFFQATEILSSCRDRAEIAGLNAMVSQINKISQNFVENQRVQTEQLSFEAIVQEGRFLEAKIGLEDLLKTIYKKPDVFVPLIKQNLESIIGKLNKKIEEEESSIQNRIDEFNDLIDKSLNFQEPIVIIEELVRRIKLNGFNQFDGILDRLTRKIASNTQKVSELESVQKIFEEGDINIAENEARQLMQQIEKGLKKTPRIFGVALIDAVKLLNSEIETAMKDGLDTLSADFAEITEKAKTALDFTEILQKIKNYQIRAQRLGEENLKNQIIVLESQVQYNANLIAKHNNLAAKYQRMEDFIQTLREIKNLTTAVQTDPAVFDQMKSVIEALHDRVENDSSNREERMRNSLQNIISEELNELNFAKASESLRGLQETSQGLAITTFNSEINKFLLICQSHKNFKIRAESALVKHKAGAIMEAREALNDVQSDLDHHDGPVLDAMVSFVKTNYDRIDGEITSEIASITEDVKGRLLKMVESKKGEEAYFLFEEKLERVRYFECEDLIIEISELMKLCTLQFDLTDKKYQKRRKQSAQLSFDKEIKTSLTTTTKIPTRDKTSARGPSFDFQVQEKTPHFGTTKELREYKINERAKKRARIVKAPKIADNLNNELRNSYTRARLQAFDRQSNRPKKHTQSVCSNCGTSQKKSLTVFCEFCGKPL
ncbi:MAG: hypothetical protein ACTSVZ_01745 [Promethearchaeota archaeon]